MRPPFPTSPRRSGRGYTLVELLIASFMGLLLISSVVFSVTGAGQSGRKQDSMSQMTEDGQIALNMLSAQLRMAGFWRPQPLGALDPQTMIRGFRTGFADPTVAFANLAAGTSTSDSVAVRYDALETNAAGATIVQPDCLGNTGAALGNPAAADYGVIDNRFYIKANPATNNPALYCLGNGSAAEQMLIDNVESMQLRYGVSAVAAVPTGPILMDPKVYSGQVARYVTANQLAYTATCSTAAPPTSPNWCGVTSVRICIVMRSNSTNAAERITRSDGTSVIPSYVDCAGNAITPTDLRLRRAMETTVSVRNRTTVAGG